MIAINLSMEPVGLKPKKSERVRRFLEFIFGFENKRGEVLDHWIYSADGFSIDPKEFYTAVEKKLSGYKIPSMEIKHWEFAEGGLLSDQRLYLHLMRERLAIDACAAPFGSIYFFSCRTVHTPALVRLWHILAAFALLNLTGYLLIKPLGFSFAMIALVTLMFAIAGVLRNAGSSAFADMDAFLLKIPIVAAIYEDWFRVDTYYREDTRALYIKLLPDLIREAAEEVSGEKGFKLVRQLQFPPILDELFRPLPPRKEKPEG
jgi:hypothetical protein